MSNENKELFSESTMLEDNTLDTSRHFLQHQTTSSDGNEKEENDNINIQLTIQQGSFLPVMCLISKGEIDVHKYIVDYQTGAKIIHYTGHFGNLKSLKTLIKEFHADPNCVDFYGLTVAHYAARQGELAILVYLKDIANLQLLDRFQYTPLHYATMNNKIYSFIFLSFNQKYRFNDNSIMQTLMTMTANGDCSDVLQILMHYDKLKPIIASVVLVSAFNCQNFKIVKLILKNLYQQINLQTYNQAIESCKQLDIHGKQFKKSLIKYKYLSIFSNSSSYKFEGSLQFIKIFLAHYSRKHANIFGSLLFILINFGLMLSCSNIRNLNLIDELDKDIFEIDVMTIFSILLYILSVLCLFIFNYSDPGYIQPLTIKDKNNILHQISDEIDNKSADNLTQIDELCFTCLTVKHSHVEHCSKCGKCVKEFHHHCKIFNKCIGCYNSRSYINFLLFSFQMACSYFIQLLLFSPQWNNTQSSNWIFKVVEIHIMPILNYDFYFFLLLILSEIYVTFMLEKIIIAITAISRNMTINELNNSWNYKYLFKILDIKRGEKKKMYNHKHQSICRNIYNVIKFFCRWNSKSLKLQRNIKVSEKGKHKEVYIELAKMN